MARSGKASKGKTRRARQAFLKNDSKTKTKSSSSFSQHNLNDESLRALSL